MDFPTAPSIEPLNFTGPFYEDGSVVVRFDYGVIPHHDPLETDTFRIAVPEPGNYTVNWSVHAANLTRPAEGALVLELRYEELDRTPIRTLDALLETSTSRT
jgi:hypothetical protein